MADHLGITNPSVEHNTISQGAIPVEKNELVKNIQPSNYSGTLEVIVQIECI